MARRRLAALAAVATTASLLQFVVGATPTQAIQPPVAFTSVNLPTWQTNGIAWATASAQGVVFVGGTFTSIRPPGAAAGTGEVARTNFAAFDAATGDPLSCAPAFDSTVPDEGATVRAMNVSPDGSTLYVGGFFNRVGGQSFQHLVALDVASCTLSTRFRPNPNATIRAIASTPDTVYFGGGITQVAGEARTRVAAVGSVTAATPGGLLPWAPTIDKEVRALAVKPDRTQVVIGGDFDTVNGAGSHAMVVVDAASAATLKNYPSGFLPQNSVVKSIDVDETGFYIGAEGTGGGVFDGRTAYDWGTFAERWRDTCLGATQKVLVYQGALYSSSHAHDCSGIGEWPDGARLHLLAQPLAGGTMKYGWFPDTNDGMGEGIGPRDMAVGVKGGQAFMWVVGEFTSVNGVSQVGITRFGQTQNAAPPQPTTSVTSFQPGRVHVSWRSSWDRDDLQISYKVFRDGNTTTPVHTVEPRTAYHWTRPQITFVDTQPAGTTHTYRVVAYDGTTSTATPWRSVTVASSSSPYAEKVLADGANAYYRYDEPSDVLFADSSGNNNNITLRGGATFQVTGAIQNDASKAVTLGGGSGATVYSENYFTNPFPYTVETWFKTTTTTGGKIIGLGNKFQLNSTNYDRHIYMSNDGRLNFGAYTSQVNVLTTPRSYNDGQWHHVVGTQSPAGLVLYVDGVRISRNTAVVTSQSYRGQWRIGGDTVGSWPNAPSSQSWAGTIDETAIYSTALSAQQVADHYSLGTGGASAGPADYYGKVVRQADANLYWRLGENPGTTTATDAVGSADGTYTGSYTLGQTGAITGNPNTALRLSGGFVYAKNSVRAPVDYSAGIWFRTTGTPGGRLFGFGNSQTGTSSSSQSDRTLFMRSDGRLAFGTRNGTAINSSATYNDGQWHHAAVTQSSTAGAALYVDGTLVASSSSSFANTPYTGYWRVGTDTLNGYPSAPSQTAFQGIVDEFAVYNSALPAASVRALWASALSTPDTAAPTVPEAVITGMSAGDSLLSWSPSLDNVGVTRYEVHRSSTAAFTPDATTLIGSPTTTSYTDAGVGAGTWFYRVLAVDAAGNRSAGSPPVSVYITDVKPPTVPADLTVTTTSSSASLSWTASTDNVGVAEYSVHRSRTPNFTVSASTLVTTVSSGTTFTDAPLAQGTYYYAVVARDGAGNVSQKSAEATAVVADVMAPSTPDGVATSVSGSSTTITWAPSTDDVAVSGYEVYRGSAPDFVPDASTLRATVAVTSYVDANAPEGISYYRIAAKDAAGNVSAASAAVSADVAPQPAVVTVPATADTWVNSGATTVNNGTSTSLAVRGTPAQTSLLRFPIPAAPAGKTLTSAVLRLRTTADTTSGSAAPESVVTADDAWSETAVTWATRPALGTAVLGTVQAGTVSLATYDTPLDVAGVTALLGQQVTLALTNNSSDGLLFYSREFSTASGRPQLILTFSPPDTTAPTAPTSLSLTRDGQNVTAAWNAASDNVAVAGYTVYRSSTQGFVPTVADVVGTPTAATFTEAPGSGTWYYRVRATDTSGNVGPFSAEASVTVADLVPPSQVTGLTATLVAGSVQLGWAAATDNVGVAGYQVHRGASADFTPSAATRIATVTAASYTDPTAPPGAVYYKVLAFDEVGNAGTPSAAATVTLPDTVAPTAPTSVTASYSSAVVTITFTPATDNVGVTAYRLYRGTTSGFAADAASLVGTFSTGTPVTDSTAPAGVVHYRLDAIDAAGNASAASTSTSVTVPDLTAPAQVTDLTASVVADSVQLAWAASTDNVGVTGYQVHRGTTVNFTPSAATLIATVTTASYTDPTAPVGATFYRIVAVDAAGNAATPSDTASVNLSDTTPPTAPTNVAASASGATVTVTFTAATDNVGVTGYRLYRGTTADFTADATTLVGTFATGTPVTDTVPGANQFYYRLQAFDAAGNLGPATASVAVTVSLPDTTAPSVPTGLAATVAGGNVQLAWTASTDNVGVTGYTVYRGTTAGFTADTTSRIGTALGAGYIDTPGSGTWYYRVAAYDAAGNTSAASAAASGEVALAAVTLSATSIGDAWVNAGATGTNYGTSVSVASRGTPAQIGLVRFAVPAAPEGKMLTGAVLRLRTTTDPTAGSVVAQSITTADNAWTESTVTWASRPALGTTVLGTIPAGTAHQTTYDTPLSASAVAELLGRQATFAVSTSTSDGFLFYSREFGSVGSRPQLILTFGSNDLTAPTAPADLAATVAGGTVNLSWTAATDDVAVANYVVYRSSTAGFTPSAADAVGTPTGTSFADNPGPGTWYYRVRAVDSSANVSASTAQVTATVTDVTAPSQVTGLTAGVVAGSVQLGWSAATDNVGVAGYQVHRGTAADFPPSAATLIATVTTASYTDSTAPVGAVFYRVVAVDAAGNAGAASAAASVTLSDTTAPTAPTDVAATASGPIVTVSFTAATDNVGVTSYRLFRGTTADFTVDASSLVATFDAGTPVTDGPITVSGVYHYRLQAVDAAGNASPPTASVPVTVPDTVAPSAPGGLAATASGADVALSWTASTDDVAVTGYRIYRGDAAGFTADAASQIATSTSTSYTDVAPSSLTQYYKVRAVDAAGNLSDPSSFATTASVDTTPPSTPTDVTATVTGGTVGLTWTASTDNVGVAGYVVHRSTTAGFTPSSATEVGTPTGTSFTDALGATGTYHYRVVARDALGNTSAASAQATAVLTDVVAPSKPLDVAAGQTATGTTVALAWARSTDEVGVTGYRVHRGSTSAFAPSAATLVASTTTLTGATEASVPAGTWFYRVVAVDAAGNASEASASVQVQVSAAPTVVALTPTADTYGNAGAPGSNFGSDSSMLSRFSTGAASYLRFEIPAAPAGKTLTGAVLRLRTNTDATAGSNDRHELRTGGDDTWVESTLTWRNRPAAGDTLLGVVPSGTGVNTAYEIPLDLAGVSTLVGGQGTISVTSPAGTDSLWLWTRNHGNTTYRPQLVLIYS